MRLYFVAIALFFSGFLSAQTVFYTSDKIPFPDLKVEIGENVSFPDVKISLGEDVPFADFTVGITDNEFNADFVITKWEGRADKKIKVSSRIPFADITIKIGADVSFPDLKIGIRKYGSVNYLVYSEKALLSKNDLIIALLPIINLHMDHKFDKVLQLSEK